MTNTEYFPFHPNPTVCRLGRVTQTVGSEGYLESEKAREGGERERGLPALHECDSALSYESFGRGLYYLQLGHSVLLSC